MDLLVLAVFDSRYAEAPDENTRSNAIARPKKDNSLWRIEWQNIGNWYESVG
jgi:hypothetical protein